MTGKTWNQTKRIGCLFISLVLTLLMSVGAACADGNAETIKTVDPVSEPDNYSAVLYDNTNGLPTAEANAIVQTSEGFIWIGSYGGLIRYDGNTFERMDSTSGIASIKCLYVDSRNRLWIGTNDNGVAVKERDTLQKWGKQDGMKSAHTRAITEDGNGTVYVATTCGIAMIDPDGKLRMMEDEAIAEANMRDLRTGSDGVVYGLTNFGDLMKIRDGKLISFLNAAESSVQGVASMLPDPVEPGKIYFEGGDFGFYHAAYGEELTDLEKIDIQPLNTVQQMEYIDGELWICSSYGIGVLSDDGIHVLENLPMNNSIGHVMRDYLGNLWFTSTRQGVMKIVRNQFSDLFERFGLQARVVNSTCMCEGKLFVATDTGLIVMDEKGPVESLPLTKAVTNTGTDVEADDLIALLDGCRIRSIIRDSQDRLWISTWRKYGLLRYAKGELTVFAQGDGPLSNSMRAVSERRDGTILVALTGGVSVIDGDKVIASYSEADGIDNTESLTVEEGTDGDIVLGSNGGGIYIINESGIRNINVEDGLPSDIVMRLKRDPKRDLIWIVTSNAIAYMTPDYKVTTVKNFPYSNNFDLFENSKGDMWVLSSNGIYVMPAEELVANGEINPVHYSIANGLCCITTANSYSELTSEGDLYIAGTTGICKVNIEQPFEKVDELKAAVPFVEADGRTLYPDGNGAFTIPSDTQKLTVPSYVFNYSLSDPQVSYQLKDFERTETTVKRSEMVPVDYTNLRGGTYDFVMTLKDSMGRGNREISIRIVKEKAFYEQVWFYIVVGLAAALLMTLLVRSYVHRRMAALEAKHREQSKRERVENELKVATQIQAGMLPRTFPAFPDRGDFDIYASMDPAKEVGGDLYDFFLVDDDHLCMVVGDVSGKGVPAALFMAIAKALLKMQAKTSLSPEHVLQEVNAQLAENNKQNMFVTTWMGVLQLSTGELTYADAGHEKLLLYQDGKWDFLPKKGGPALAVLSAEDMELLGKKTLYRNQTITLKPGDAIYQYTDGVTEATDAHEELFGETRLLDAMNSAPSVEPGELLPYVRQQIDAFVKEADQFDDITMLGLLYKGK